MLYDFYKRKTYEGESKFFQAHYVITYKTHQREGKHEFFLNTKWNFKINTSACTLTMLIPVDTVYLYIGQ